MHGAEISPRRSLRCVACFYDDASRRKSTHPARSLIKRLDTLTRRRCITQSQSLLAERAPAENSQREHFSDFGALASTPPGMPGTHPPIFWLGGTSTGISPQYYYVLLDRADQYWLPSVRSASSRFHSAIRRHQFASVRQADSWLTRLVPPTLNSR